jgi:ABC-type polysaccharide transport system permease subunit
MDSATTDQSTSNSVTFAQTAQQSDNQLLAQEGIQGAFYNNILAGGVRPTIVAILIIAIGNILETGTFFGFLVPVDVLLFTS